MEFNIKTKYEVGDKVWIMVENFPQRVAIRKITIQGAEIDANGGSENFGKVAYYLEGIDRYQGFCEEQLYDTFDQLRDYVFPDSLRDQ